MKRITPYAIKKQNKASFSNYYIRNQEWNDSQNTKPDQNQRQGR